MDDNLRNQLENRLHDISILLDTFKDIETELKPPVVQEAILGRRHLEDAQTRYRVALEMMEKTNGSTGN